MGKKVREYKSGDFIFAKVKGYPAWPARVQKLNGKRYFVYFYGTGETANLPPNMIFDYAENKDKFLTKTVKRRDFNDGVKQIEHDFANNVPLEDVIGVPVEAPADGTADETLNDTANDTADDTMDTTAADDAAEENTTNTTAQNETAVEDSDDTGALVIDEGNKKGKKAKLDPKPKDTPKAKEPKTPRGKAKKEEEAREEEEEKGKKEEELVSRSGRKIRPKRYIDEQTEENSTLPSPAPKKRRGASPTAEKENVKEKSIEKTAKHYNTVSQSELEDLKEPYKPDDAEKENILITYLPTGQYIGIKLFQSRPTSFKSENARLQWDKQAASNAVTLKLQLERSQIKPESVLAQLVMDLNLTDEEKTTLDKERETEEKKSRVQFLKTEMKLIELDAKIKTCLCLEKADTELCLKLLDELMELEVKPLMLLKHPTCVETVKRMRAYVGNTPSWDLSESAALQFSKQALRIRKLADTLYKNMKELFTTPDGLSFWEYFSERVSQFKKVTAKLTADELLEMVHEPLEMSVPTSHNMKSAIETANEEEKDKTEEKEKEKEDDNNQKKKTPVKPKKQVNNTPSKATKRQSSRNKQEEKEKEVEKEKEKEDEQTETPMETDAVNSEEATSDKEAESNATKNNEEQTKEKEIEKEPEHNDKDKGSDTNVKVSENSEPIEKANDIVKDIEADSDDKNKDLAKDKEGNKEKETKNKNGKEKETKSKDGKEIKEKDAKDNKEKGKDADKESKEDNKEEKEKEKEIGEPRAKRSRESKKTEAPPPRSPAKRKSKF
ncbi:PC4 and SFRS1-interacting protein [Plodia interpunctella]|uniref:PC4 and SFRS1-interacting protein n=1 Tax=Plodia interpunctella TaxID=58824 RepID=UPI002367EB85|nr:PC4 and SFRS1-interacting protein [Plodia interpunctella]XP_053621354.1 PC4 and SFRS1-interacting protein [Plodia interpunctella]